MDLACKMEKTLPDEVIAEAKELVRGSEVLPEGVQGLAAKIWRARQEGRPLRVKLGVDPTSTDLHLGHAVVFRKLRRFQELGHQVVLIIGGFTAQIGDPSGRNSTRPPLGPEEVAVNAQTYLDQIGLILDLEKTEITNNSTWLAPMNLSEMLKIAGKVTVNQLLAKEAFGDRLDKQLPVGVHELFYPLLQAYDSVAIRADIELGGTDQRFNILQGRELQPYFEMEPQLAMLLPLLEGTDGIQKMSKSYKNYIALKDEQDDMFGKCMRIPDNLIIKYFELTTTLPGSEIDKISAQLKAGTNPKILKEKLAAQIVKQYHGDKAATAAFEQWQKVHSERQLPEDIETRQIAELPLPLFKLLVSVQFAASSAEAKRLVGEGAVRLDGQPVKDANFPVAPAGGQEITLQVGRRKFLRIKA